MRYVLPIVTCVVFLLSACKKQECNEPESSRLSTYFPGNTDEGWASGYKEGQDWRGSSSGAIVHTNNSYLGFSFQTYTKEFYAREVLGIGTVPLKIGTYKLNNPIYQQNQITYASYSTLVADGDVIGDHYIVDESVSDNMVVLSELDTVARTAAGTFDVSFVIDPNRAKSYPENPDHLRFTKMAFWVKY